MKLHWSPKSPFVRKVMVCAHELNALPKIELVRSVAAMLKPNPAIMKDNPLSKIPTLVLDDGRSLFDSRVICEYLDEQAGGVLCPPQGEARWFSQRWHAFGDGLLDALVLWRNERDRDEPSQPLMQAFELKVIASLDQLEREATELQDAPFCIGHIAVGCALGYIDYRFDELAWRQQAPNLATWFLAVSQRPSFQQTEPVDG